MNRIASLTFIFIICAGSFAQTAESHPSQVDQQHTAWIGDAMRTIETIRVGMTRSDLAKIFTTEGGLSTAARRTYVYRQCRFIKVDVKFDVVTSVEEQPTDKIVEVSRPYLAWSVMD
jgi:hypothetical protein